MKKVFFSVLAFSMFFTFACGKKNIKKPADENIQKVEEITSIPTDSMIQEADIRTPEFISHEAIKTVYFGFDKYELTPESMKTLQTNADFLKQKKATILIEGHCDNRGTIEYNLALGQKRANVIKDYYMKLGVSENTIGTISYGEESPSCKEETEICWQKNRRAETKVALQ